MYSSIALRNDDVRIGEIIEKIDSNLDAVKKGSIVIVGFPYDEGVRRNGGRVGAKLGPKVFREKLPKIGTVVNPERKLDLTKIPSILDFGDIDESGSLEDGHVLLNRTVKGIIERGGIPFIIGGGNDQSYPNGSALLDLGYTKIGVINIDAHLDVRPLKNGKVHSGTPFRQLLEDSRFAGKFTEFGAQGSCCSEIHSQYVIDNGGKIVWLSDIKSFNGSAVECFKKELLEFGNEIFVSFDIDAVSGDYAPGVSAVATVGLSAQDAIDIAEASGRDNRVKLMDLSEFNPLAEDHRTGRLIASVFYSFCLGNAYLKECEKAEKREEKGKKAKKQK